MKKNTKRTNSSKKAVEKVHQAVPAGTSNIIMNFLREGKTDREIALIIIESLNLSEKTAEYYIKLTKAHFKNEVILDKKFNIVQHIRRYDRDIFKLLKYEPKVSSFSQFNALKTQAMLDMVMLMQKKERVLGFHQKRSEIKIKNNLNINLKTLKRVFDFSELSKEEKIKLYNIIEKTKISEEERFTIKPNPNKTIEIENNEDKLNNISLEEANINKIQVKIENNQKNDEQIRFEEKNVIDAVNRDIKPKSIDEIKSNLLKNLLK